MNPMIANLGWLKTEFESIQMPIEQKEGFRFDERKIDKEEEEVVTYASPWSRYGQRPLNNDE